MEEYSQRVKDLEIKRAQEMAQREERIQKLMNNMSDNVLRKSNDAEKELERRAVLFQLEKEQFDSMLEEKKKVELKRKNEEIRQSLFMQVQEKQKQKENELYATDDYMKKWSEQLEQEENRRKDLENKHKIQMLQVKDY